MPVYRSRIGNSQDQKAIRAKPAPEVFEDLFRAGDMFEHERVVDDVELIRGERHRAKIAEHGLLQIAFLELADVERILVHVYARQHVPHAGKLQLPGVATTGLENRKFTLRSVFCLDMLDEGRGFLLLRRINAKRRETELQLHSWVSPYSARRRHDAPADMVEFSE